MKGLANEYAEKALNDEADNFKEEADRIHNHILRNMDGETEEPMWCD